MWSPRPRLHALLTNNGRWWAWHSHSNASVQHRSSAQLEVSERRGGAGVGGAGLAWDSCVGIIPARSQHTGGVNVCLADGSVRFVSDNISLLTWQRLGNIKDGQKPEPF